MGVGVSDLEVGGHEAGVNGSRDGLHGAGVSVKEGGGQGARVNDLEEGSHRVGMSDFGNRGVRARDG
jgi:hypothetical protein